MEPRTRERHLQNWAVLIAGCAILGGLAYLLHRELRPSGTVATRDRPVAKLAVGIRQVQRKLDRQVLWNDIATQETLFNRDSIRTTPGSEAKIQFDDGTVLELAENSLVILDRSDEKIGIEFLKGSLFARSTGGQSSAVEIKTSQGRVSLAKSENGGELALASGAKGLQVTVAKGQAELKTDQGTAQLRENEQGEVGTAGITKRRVTFVPKLPVPQARIIIPQEGPAPVPFEWSNPEGTPIPAKLQISAFPDFSRLIHQGVAQGRINIRLPPGTYYWRLIAPDSPSDMSDKRSFHLVRHVPLRLESPAAGTRLTFLREQPVPKLAWTSPVSNSIAHGAALRVEMSSSADFSSPLKTVQTSSNDATLDPLPSGTYFWRVVSRYEGVGADGRSVTEIPSETRNFAVAQLDRLPAPTLTVPTQDGVVSLAAGQSKVRFGWSPVPEARSYRLSVFTDAQRKHPLLRRAVTVPETEEELAASGRLYWTVEASPSLPSGANEEGEHDSRPSSTHAFLLSRAGGFKLVSPENGRTFEFLRDKPEVEFSWEPSGGASRYVVEIAPDEKFNTVLFEKRIRSSSEGLPRLMVSDLPVGQRYWRVKALDGDDQTLAVSQVGKYRLTEAPLLTAPEKSLPMPLATMVADSSPKVTFSWKPVAQAQGYLLTIRRQNALGKLEDAWTEETRDTAFERRLPPGSYQWDVQAIDLADRKGTPGAPRLFEVRLPDRLAAPVIAPSLVGLKVQERRPREILLRWDEVPGAESYTITLSRLNPDGTQTQVLRKNVDDNEFKTPETLSSGTYSWEVVAVGVAPGAKSKVALPGEATGSQFSVHWNGVLPPPKKLGIRVETDSPDQIIREISRSPASSRLEQEIIPVLTAPRPRVVEIQ